MKLPACVAVVPLPERVDISKLKFAPPAKVTVMGMGVVLPGV